MTRKRSISSAASRLSDERVRRAIHEQIKQRRAKRMRALERFERSIRAAENARKGRKRLGGVDGGGRICASEGAVCDIEW